MKKNKGTADVLCAMQVVGCDLVMCRTIYIVYIYMCLTNITIKPWSRGDACSVIIYNVNDINDTTANKPHTGANNASNGNKIVIKPIQMNSSKRETGVELFSSIKEMYARDWMEIRKQ
jgi:hypothetical protein